ncbi:hypothetical protein [Streptomyces sp. NPDC058755]|uniref:hypothetical protein n=1 Tax=Streptomyces sp. NPDC058755 TaxID=3346624 RepID=UPI003698D605
MSPDSTPDLSRLSAECDLAQRPGYEGLHGPCHRTEDIPLPHSAGLVLLPRCACLCHRRRREGGAP